MKGGRFHADNTTGREGDLSLIYDKKKIDLSRADLLFHLLDEIGDLRH